MITLKNSIQSSIVRIGGGVPPSTVAGVWYDYPDVPTTTTLRYNMVPYPIVLADNCIFSIHKLSSNHAAGEIIMMGVSRDGGATRDYRQTTVGGVLVGGTNLVASKIGLYVYLARQTDTQNVEISRCLASEILSDFDNADFTVVDNYDFGGAGYLVGTRAFMEISNGEIWLPYFFVESGHGFCSYLKSSDGLTFTNGNVAYDRVDSAIPVEPCYIETSPGTIVCMMRRLLGEGGAYFYQAKSTDYGENWSTLADPAVYTFGDTQGNPIEVFIRSGTVYMINCNRKVPTPFKIEYATATIADFEAKNQGAYSAVQVVPYTVGASNPPFNVPQDFGYCVAFQDWEGKIWVQFYDISADHDGTNGRQCWIYQIKITD